MLHIVAERMSLIRDKRKSYRIAKKRVRPLNREEKDAYWRRFFMVGAFLIMVASLTFFGTRSYHGLIDRGYRDGYELAYQSQNSPVGSRYAADGLTDALFQEVTKDMPYVYKRGFRRGFNEGLRAGALGRPAGVREEVSSPVVSSLN
ncbi:MAG: hypothetical protein HQK60_10465 [Deltaproteobacteria bacterium]|nr:hypothetical protein [Deltaproteobacteria bacterium]